MSKLAAMEVDQLVQRFAEITVEQGRAADRLNTRAYNRLYVQMMEVANELRQRPSDQRRALMALYEHPQAQVRMMAAHMTLAIAYQSARDVLQAILIGRNFLRLWMPGCHFSISTRAFTDRHRQKP